MTRAAFLPSALVMLAVAGCGSAGWSPSHRFQNAGSLLQHHEGPRAELRAIQAEARVDQRGDRGRIRGTVMMFVERSGRVRFDVMTQFGPVLTLTSDAQAFALSDMRERTFTHGPACEQNIARLLGMPVSAQQAAALLLGGAPDINAGEQDVTWQSDSGRYLIVRRAGDLIARLELELREEDRRAPLQDQRFRLRRSSLVGADGHVHWEAEYADYQTVEGAEGQRFDLPFVVRVMQPSTETDTLVRFQEIEPNPDIPHGAFTQAPPAGVTIEEAPCE